MTLSLLSSQMFVQLHLVARALSFLGCISGIYVSGTLLTRSWRRRSKPTTDAAADTPTRFSPSNSIYGSWLNTAFPDTSTRTDAGSLLIFLCALGLLATAMVSERPKKLIEMQDVHILQQYDANTFQADVAMSSGQRTEFVLNFCPSSNVTPEIKPGVSMHIWYMEDRIHGDCFDVSPGDDRGYELRRDHDRKPILGSWSMVVPTVQRKELANTGPTAASGPSGPYETAARAR